MAVIHPVSGELVGLLFQMQGVPQQPVHHFEGAGGKVEARRVKGPRLVSEQRVGGNQGDDEAASTPSRSRQEISAPDQPVNISSSNGIVTSSTGGNSHAGLWGQRPSLFGSQPVQHPVEGGDQHGDVASPTDIRALGGRRSVVVMARMRCRSGTSVMWNGRHEPGRHSPGEDVCLGE
ncbi:hypothetical protein GCM10018793_69520 [Streptomyces sulfonofaciens]|uniref:Uncharacterized protein n=1 Tax=Streptomyces sulfonofaciens TaxID=68272 RepID=A0A919GQF8_9ACTN|nr:hypothetical protein GCM10018793_69520 [Streptomyces sulfonofaciens]